MFSTTSEGDNFGGEEKCKIITVQSKMTANNKRPSVFGGGPCSLLSIDNGGPSIIYMFLFVAHSDFLHYSVMALQVNPRRRGTRRKIIFAVLLERFVPVPWPGFKAF